MSALLAPGVHGALVNAAGDIAAWGRPDAQTPFRIGVADPFDPSNLACVVEVGGAIATSGTYERGAHLVNPRSGDAAAAVASASVCGPDLGLADALATAVAVCGSTDVVDALDGYEAFIIGLDGRWRWTEGFPFASNS